MSNSLKSGTCPKCSSNEVYTDRELLKRGERMQLVISSWKTIDLDTYICPTCGYFEEHTPEKDLRNAKLMAKIKETWKRVSK